MQLEDFRKAIESEMFNILDFWKFNSVDKSNGGFIAKLDSFGRLYPDADKGLVLNARILWSFSAAFNHNNDAECLVLAKRAYNYLRENFNDTQNGGVYWSVDSKSKPQNTRKQIYGLAFTIYGLSEFYKATKIQASLDWAIELYDLIEKHSLDQSFGGYLEAFSADWQLIYDLRLSEKDRNDPKTMNTHLHIIEAYANLYEVWRVPKLKNSICNLLDIFETKIIDNQSFHLKLFFLNDWLSQSDTISYGHDIEASWLLLDCAIKIDEQEYITKFTKYAIHIADATTEGLSHDGSLYHEYSPSSNHTDFHREWWVSAEAMVGFLNAYQISKDPKYLAIILKIWEFTTAHLLDNTNGEWYWGVFDDYSKMTDEDKIGFWKCPYHNLRACLEILKRTK